MAKRIVMLVLAAVVIAGLVIVGCAPEAAPPPPAAPEEGAPPAVPETEVLQWRMVTQGPAVSIWHYLNQYFVDIVKDMSGGRIEITLYPGGSLFPVTDTLDNVSKGIVEMGMLAGVNFAGQDPAFTAMNFLPGCRINTFDDEATYIWHSGWYDLTLDIYHKYGIEYLAPGYIPSEQFLSTVPIRSVADYKGLKIRGVGGSALLFKELGAETEVISGGEVYTALQLGTVDAADLAGAAGNWDMGAHEVTKYIIEPCFHCPIAQLDYIINQNTWNSLPPDLKAIVEVAAKAGGEYFGNEIRYENIICQNKMIDSGLEVITLPEEDQQIIHKAALEVWDQIAASSPESAKFVELYKEIHRLVGKPME